MARRRTAGPRQRHPPPPTPEEPPPTSPWPLRLTLVAAALYCVWLGGHWLPLDMSDKELAATASRVWDFRRELVTHHRLPWWTPYFMSGSSYGMARGFGLVPWLAFSAFTDLITAGKLVALSAILASAAAMFCCARRFLADEWGAALAAMVFLLHPEQVLRAAGAEHVTISLFFPFIPLLWLTLSRALDTHALRDVFLCALTAAMAWWTDNKQAFVNFAFLAAYVVYWTWAQRGQWRTVLRTGALLAGLGLLLGAPFLTPGLVESREVKLFADDPLAAWQDTYAFKSLTDLVDRDGAIATAIADGVSARLHAHGDRLGSQAEVDQVRRIFALKAFAAEKYIGVVALALLGVTILGNDRRRNPRAFWFFNAALLASISAATGMNSVWSANRTTWEALAAQGQSTALLMVAGAGAAFFAALMTTRFTSARQRAGGLLALAIFLFVPAFRVLSVLPYFDTIRAPYVFYDGPATFLIAILSGFLVPDVLQRTAWRPRVPMVVALAVLLLLLDYWPYQKPAMDNGVPERTLANLRATYGALAADGDWVKTYAISNRYFHLLGPMYGGKPQAYEAFNDWLAPSGMGALQRAGGGSPALYDLLGVRYIVVDKSSAGLPAATLTSLLDGYRRTFAPAREDDDFVVFRNDGAHAYVTAYAKACAYAGDVRESAHLSLALAARHWPLVHRTDPIDGARYERVYRAGTPTEEPTRDGDLLSLDDLRLTRDDNEHVRIHLTAPADCLAVVAESYYPFWRAEVDGQPAEVLRVSTGLMGLELSQGPHDIALTYRHPPTYDVAAVVGLLGLLAGGAVAFGRGSNAPTAARRDDP